MKHISIKDYLLCFNQKQIENKITEYLEDLEDCKYNKSFIEIDKCNVINDPNCGNFLVDIQSVHIVWKCVIEYCVIDKDINIYDKTATLYLSIICRIFPDEIRVESIILQNDIPYLGTHLKVTDSLVPIIPSDLYDLIGERICGEFDEGYGFYKTIEKSNAEIIFFPIYKEEHKYGKTFFNNSEITYKRMERRRVQPGTILCDSNFEGYEKRKERNNILAHEFVHWILHRNFMFLKNCYSINSKAIRDFLLYEDKFDLSSEIKWMENQATYIAPRILMPKNSFLSNANKLILEIENTYPNFHKTTVLNELIKCLSEMFVASKLSVKIRLAYLGFDEVRGVNEFVNGKYIPNFSFKKGSLRLNETYTIGFLDLIELLKYNTEIRELYKSKKILYIDGHLIVNDKKYICITPSGSLGIKYSALKHIDECAIKFKLKYELGELLEYNFLDSCLNKVTKTLNKVIIDRNDCHYTFDIPNECINTCVEERYIYEHLYVYNNPGITLKNIIEYNDLKQTALCELLMIDISDFNKFLNGKTKNTINKVNLIKICKYLKIPNTIIYRLCDETNNHLASSNVKDLYLMELIESPQYYSLVDIKKFLGDHNL